MSLIVKNARAAAVAANARHGLSKRRAKAIYQTHLRDRTGGRDVQL